MLKRIQDRKEDKFSKLENRSKEITQNLQQKVKNITNMKGRFR